MSHLTERKEKNCLNCGTEVVGRYCHVCGQENLVPKETFWHLVAHFIYDVTHFDGKFFATLKYLLFRPGFLSEEYIRGRRMTYLHPIRMYVFSSAIFFLAFFAIIGGRDDLSGVKEDTSSYSKLYGKLAKMEKKLATEKDSIDRMDTREQIEVLQSIIDTRNLILAKRVAKGESIGEDTLGLGALGGTLRLDSLVAGVKSGAIKSTKIPVISTGDEDDNKKDTSSGNWGFDGESLPSRVSAYDSMEAAKPAAQRPSAISHYFNRRLVAINQKYHENKSRFFDDAKEGILHTFPKILFVSLPLFAALLRLLNIRKRRRKLFFYVDHGIFTIHLYVATFILMLILMLLQQLQNNIHQGWLRTVMVLLGFSVFVYEYIAMKKFYKQGWFKTFVKFCILNTMASILIGILTAIFTVWALIEL